VILLSGITEPRAAVGSFRNLYNQANVIRIDTYAYDIYAISLESSLSGEIEYSWSMDNKTEGVRILSPHFWQLWPQLHVV
jgi:hypothetical protein